MATFAGDSRQARLAAIAKKLKSELMQIDSEINEEKKALARIEAQIRVLARGHAQAA